VVYYKQKSTLDDTLDVFPCHGVGGIVGMLLTGVFATKAVNGAGADGLLLGNPGFLWIQVKGMLIAVSFSFVMSFIIFKFINFIQPMRVSSEEEELGLDSTQHNEKYLQGTLLVSSNGTSHLTETEIEKGTIYTS
ncbi:MAG: ammonia channel protein, partial [Chitinophagaceae bacterium]